MTEVDLNSAKRDFARRRIFEAARKAFVVYGVDAVTMEQIALAAGTRRSTVYNHFRDKDAILRAIADDFGGQLSALADELPGPAPTRVEIDAWVRNVSEFAHREQTPTMMLLQLGMSLSAPPALTGLGDAFMQTLAEKIPAFAKATAPASKNALARARASAALRQLGTACALSSQRRDSEMANAALTVAAEMLERFIQEQHDD